MTTFQHTAAPDASAEVELLKKRLSQYRELVRRLAVARDKNEAWYVSKAWCPFWRELAFDLPNENEQQDMLFK